MDNQEKLKEELWKIWNNNPVFRDNIAFLTQAHLRSLPAQIVKESVERMEDIYRYDLSYETSTPPRSIYSTLKIQWIYFWKIRKVFVGTVTANFL